MLRLNSKTAEEICKIRWDFISQIKPKTVLDYGCGCGWFRAFRPQGIEVFSYDIGPYPQTGIELKMYDVVCFWDVLEHIPDFSDIEPILALARHVAVAIPIKPDSISFQDFKHFKPGEHLHYWTQETLVALFQRYGFELLKADNVECEIREQITSFLFKRFA